MASAFLDSPMLRSVAFHPRRASRGGGRHRCVDATYAVPPVAGHPSVSIGYRAYPLLHSRRPSALVLHWHGNGELAAELDHCVHHFHAANCALVAFDFRGYGWSEGLPSLLTLCSDAAAVLDALPRIASQAGADVRDGARVKTPIIIYGRSIGSVCAVQLAAELANHPTCIEEADGNGGDGNGGGFCGGGGGGGGAGACAICRGLILECGISDLFSLPMAQQLALKLGPQGEQLVRSLPDVFEMEVKLSALPPLLKTLVIHGDGDGIVPVAQGRALHAASLAAAAHPHLAQMILVEGAGHNDLSSRKEFAQGLGQFLKAVATGGAIVALCEDGGGGWQDAWRGLGEIVGSARDRVLACLAPWK